MSGVGFGRAFQILIFLSFFFPIKTISKNNSSSNVLCIEIERDALLKFKKELQDPSNRLSSWIPKVDCCKWVGIHCDSLTGHVKELNLSNTQYVEWHTVSELNSFRNSQLKGSLSYSILNLKHLTYINLSYNSFQGLIPHQLGNLSNLQRLDLQGNYFYSENLHWIQSLHSLVSLDLSGTNLSKVFDWLLDINKLPFLEELYLSECQLDHITPSSHINFTSLFVLDISSNNFMNTFIPKWISKLGNLVSLDLSYNRFQGPLPEGFSNLTSLENLNLAVNELNSSLPKWLFSLTSISSLNLFYNRFEGPIPCAIQNLSALTFLDLSRNNYFNSTSIPSCLYSLHNLQYLNLASLNLQGEISNDIANLTNLVSLRLQLNKLVGNIPGSIASLCNLRHILIFTNKISGPIPEHIGNLSSLEYLVLSRNELSGTLPKSIGNLSSLEILALSGNKLSGTLPKSIGLLSSLCMLSIFYNSFEGTVSEVHFANLRNLKELEVSDNYLTLSFSVGWVPPFNLGYIKLRSCNLGPHFPKLLKSQRNVIHIDLSNAKISDIVPDWFWNLSTSYEYLDLSHNQLSGKIPDFHLNAPLKSIRLGSNKFDGNLPQISSNVVELDLSNNSFAGNMSYFLCHSISQNNKQLEVLDLEDNLLSGNIPDCWTNWMLLNIVKLSSNNLSGKLPSSMGSLINLHSLHLRNNSLSGKIPLSLQNCLELLTLDLGLNAFHGNIPTWIGTNLGNLMFLGLRSNKLSGLIPHELCHLSSLQIMDIGSNNFIGSIPHCFGNFTAMATKQRLFPKTSIFHKFLPSGLFFIDQFLDNAFVITKGEEFQYDKIMGLMTSMDLSHNNLSGEIPQEITNLLELKSLNLSGNNLRGSIPEQIESMTNMESLDLSRNQLSGKIPQSIAKLTFLNYLNLSYNHLLGPIPTSTQLQSFDPSSFIGNELCGLPLPNSCSTEKTKTNTENEEAKEDDENFIDQWFYLSLAIGFLVGFWGIWGPLLISKTWRHTYFRHVISLWHKFN